MSMCGKNENCIQNFSKKTLRKETIQKDLSVDERIKGQCIK